MRILVLQLKRIGDTILTTPVITALRDHLPAASITVALDSSTAALAPALGADRTLVFRRGAGGWTFWRDIAAGRFDVCIDLTGNDRSAVATALSRAPRRITWSRFARKPLRSALYTEFVESSVRDRHTADHHTDLLRSLGIHVEGIGLSLNLPDSAREEALRALSRSGVTGPFAIVHPGTARPEKYWLPERWSEVIDAISSRFQLTVVMTGSDDSSERRHLEAIIGPSEQLCVNLAGQLSLLGTAAVIEKSRLLCAVDSAPVHLADALGTPLVALFGPTNPFHWRPRGSKSRIITATRGSLAPNFPKAPMKDINSADVIAGISELLGNEDE